VRTEDFDYELPEELIAQTPLADRSAARLLVLDRRSGGVRHAVVRELPELLSPGDLLVLNDTRVLPVRLGARRRTGGRVELLFLAPDAQDPEVQWMALARPARRLRTGEVLEVVSPSEPEAATGVSAEVVALVGEGQVRVRLRGARVREAMDRWGTMPLPPYIRAPLADPERYQTVYARVEGSAAAPTAGLHFTPELLEAVRARGVGTAFLTLHVGLGTFRPVTAERPEEHRLHAEWFRLPPETAEAVARHRRAGGRVVAVGTTVTRVLETQATDDGCVRPGEGWTDLYILPGFRFRVVDGLLTNFHLPRSTLLMLVAAFAGRERVLAAYREAVAQRYRFYSFGDAMLVL
jgi:S-adenosylmethionine:tRNA ribosyltransferase-isomerase